ncbi:MAG: hypothetical protein ACLP9L_18220 [Thermoguttaceae bacterium]
MTAPLQDILIQLADAMVTEMNAVQSRGASPFSRKFTAQRVYDYTRDLEETTILRVDAVPEVQEDEPFTRQSWRGTGIVSIAIREKLKVENIAAVDALTYFTGQLRDFWTLPPRRLANFPAAVPIKRKIVYPYLQKQLREHGQFVSVLQLTFNLVSQ